MMFRLSVVPILFFLAAFVSADIRIGVDVANGDRLAGERQFTVTVTTDSLVTQVEFYVNGRLRETDRSRPYEFRFDALAEDEGDIELAFAAYTADGTNARVTINAIVDNDLDLGLDHHIEAAQEALTESKWDEAIHHGRIALKIDPRSADANIAMARANLGKGVLDLAQKFAIEAREIDPNSRAVAEIYSLITLRVAFDAMAQGENNADLIDTVQDAITTAASLRRQTMDQAIEEFGDPTDENLMQYIDLLLEGHRYSLVIQRLRPMFDADQQNTEVANRLVYAMIRSGRIRDAAQTFRNYERFGYMDGYAYALRAILEQYAGERQASLDAEREALLSDPAGRGVRSAQAYLALARNNPAALAQISSSLAQSEDQSAISNYYLAATFFSLRDYNESRRVSRIALLADPLMYDMYIEHANQSIFFALEANLGTQEKEHQLNFAKAYAEGALVARPESFEALTALSLIESMLGNHEAAVRYGRGAIAAGPQYGSAFYALAGALDASRADVPPSQQQSILAEARSIMQQGVAIDENLRGKQIPSPQVAWFYFYSNGRIPLVAPPARS